MRDGLETTSTDPGIGWSVGLRYRVEPEQARAYADATGGRAGAHLADPSPPFLAVVPMFRAMKELLEPVVPHEVRGRVVHGEHDLRVFAPMPPGAEVDVRAGLFNVRRRSSGTTVTCVIDCLHEGVLLNRQYMLCFYRGADFIEEQGPDAPVLGVALGDAAPDVETQLLFPPDVTLRYASASEDDTRIHLDDAFARSVGLPGVIVHGLCTLATAVNSVMDALGEPDRRLRRAAVRFAQPLTPAEHLRTKAWTVREEAGRRRLAFESSSASGTPVLTRGELEFGPLAKFASDD